MDATTAAVDGETVRDIVGRSMRASFSLSPDQITAIVESEFGDERIAELEDSDDGVVIVAEREDEPVGVVTGSVSGGDGELEWLFVAPEGRGRGVGTELFEAGRDALEERGADTVRASVLSENEEGEQFFEQFGYEQLGHSELAVGEDSFATYIYGPEGGDSDQELHRPDSVDTADGDTVYTGDEDIPGKMGPFLRLYTDADRTEKYGFFCTSCGTMANASDGLDRIECDTCGNEHRPDEWDGSYL